MNFLSKYYLLFLAIFISIVHSNKIVSNESLKPNPIAEIQKTEMQNLDKNLPDSFQLALKRINQYRLVMRLPVWEYDSSLSKMAQSHANYVLLNCNAGRPTGGHFENPKFPGYTKEGDEAARTSGISGGPDPLYGLERLIEGVYHRSQFINPNKMRVGIGFTYDTKTHCGSTLFVSRPIESMKEDQYKLEAGKYIVFPPDGFEDNLTDFISEWPDPRPVKIDKSSGYMASISLSHDDVNNLVDTKATLTDSSGKTIPIWETNPAKPTYKNPPPGMGSVYTNPQGNPFSKNFNMVFIMPKEPLKANEKYSIKTVLKFKNKEDTVEWTFKTRGNQTWNISTTKDLQNSENLYFARTHSFDNDIYLFENGTHVFEKVIWFHKSIRLIGKEKSSIGISSNTPMKGYLLNFGKGGNFLLENLSFNFDKIGFLYSDQDAIISIKNVNFENNPISNFQFNHGSRVTVESSRFINLGSNNSNLFCLRGGKPNSKDAKLIFGNDNVFQNIQSGSTSCGSIPEKQDKKWYLNPSSKNSMSLKDAIVVVGKDEEIHLSKGDFDFSEPTWIGERKISIYGEEGTKIINKGKNNSFLLFNNGELSFQNLELVGQCGFFSLKPNTKLSLKKITIQTSENNCYFAGMEGNSSLSIENSNFSNYASRLLIFSHSQSAKIFLNHNNTFPDRKEKFVPIAGKVPK